MWHSDIGTMPSQPILKRMPGRQFREEADKRYGHVGRLRKNSLHIGASLAFAWEAEKYSAGLADVCSAILEPKNYVS